MHIRGTEVGYSTQQTGTHLRPGLFVARESARATVFTTGSQYGGCTLLVPLQSDWSDCISAIQPRNYGAESTHPAQAQTLRSTHLKLPSDDLDTTLSRIGLRHSVQRRREAIYEDHLRSVDQGRPLATCLIIRSSELGYGGCRLHLSMGQARTLGSSGWYGGRSSLYLQGAHHVSERYHLLTSTLQVTHDKLTNHIEHARHDEYAELAQQ